MKKIAVLLISTFLLILVLSRAGSPPTQAQGGCTELVVNGNMEDANGWSFPATAIQGGYSLEQFLSPQHSARLGIVEGDPIFSFSSMRQTVQVPDGTHLYLQWHMWPRSVPFDSEDLQYVQILKPPYLTHLRTMWDDVRDDQAWMTCSYDISEFLNQDITLNFGVRNSDSGGVTAMYVDDVSVRLCPAPQPVIEGCLLSTPTPTPTPTTTPTPTFTPSPTATPTPTGTNTPTATPTASPSPTPTATPTSTPSPVATTTPPPSCRQLLHNPDFSTGEDGYAGWTQNLFLTAAYTDTLGESHHGAWFGGATFTDQYLYQDIVPAAGNSLQLSLIWTMDTTTDTILAPEEALTITLRQTDDTVLETLAVLDNNAPRQRWQSLTADLFPASGAPLRLHFQARTSDHPVSWYVTDAQIMACGEQHLLYLPVVWKK